MLEYIFLYHIVSTYAKVKTLYMYYNRNKTYIDIIN